MDNDTWAWDQYWHFDRVASCFDEFGRANYGAHIADGWRGFFDGLRTKARLLDLCTGNGAVALLAAEFAKSKGRQFAITGIDRSAIDPARFAPSHRASIALVEFVGGVRAEQLPFGGGRFDAVMSQYGIEYSDLDQSLTEAVRVLRPGGWLRLAMHAAEGSVVVATRANLADADMIIDEVDFPGKAASAFRAVLAAEREPGNRRETKLEADRAFAAFAEATTVLRTHLPAAADRRMIENAVSVILHAWRHRAHFKLPELLDKVEEIRSEINAHRARQRALVDAAVTKAQVAEIAETLKLLGVAGIEFGQQQFSGALVGHVICGQLRR